MVFRVLLTLSTFFVCLLYFWFISSPKKTIRNTCLISKVKYSDIILNESHELKGTLSLDRLKLFLWTVILGLVLFDAYLVYFKNIHNNSATLYLSSMGDGILIFCIAAALYLSGWSPMRRGKILINKEFLYAPRFFTSHKYRRETTVVHSRQISKTVFRCIVSDSFQIDQFYIDSESILLLQIWASSTNSTIPGSP